MIDRISFFCPGLAKTAGSKKAFMRPEMKFPVIVSDSDNKGWRNAVAGMAREHYSGPPLAVPLKLTLVFQMKRPQGHFNSKGALKPGAPTYCSKRPDATKLLRCVEDALNGVLWLDDSQIVVQHVSKIYDERPGVQFDLWPQPPLAHGSKL